MHCPNLRIESVDRGNVLGNHAVPVRSVVEDSVAVLACLGTAAGKGVAILPEEIASDTSGVESCLLPRVLYRAVVGAAVLLQQAGLASSDTTRAVGSNPKIAPVVWLAPFNRVSAISSRSMRTS